MYPIYFDNHATTRLDPRVREKMWPYLDEFYGNASSRTHAYGWVAQKAVEKSRRQVAEILNARPREIFFTSGATESINLAILGQPELGTDFEILTSSVEHSATMGACQVAQERGVRVTYLKVNSYGQIEIESLQKALSSQTKLVSLIWGNNEIGSLNPIAEVGEVLKNRDILFHVDASQVIGKVSIDVEKMGIDLLSLSAHKFHGPKGVGALFVRQKPRAFLNPLLFGGGQQNDLRPGTLNVPGIVGLAKACEICLNEGSGEIEQMRGFQQQVFEAIAARPGPILINGDPDNRLCNNISLSFPGRRPDELFLSLQNFAFSTGSACASGQTRPSHVLLAIGRAPEEAAATARFGLSRFTTEAEVSSLIQALTQFDDMGQ